jgi:hypothetical protein
MIAKRELTVVSMFTWEGPNGDYYRESAERLGNLCGAMGLNYWVHRVPYRGGWMETIRQKPWVILRVLDAVGGPVLWIDVDDCPAKQPNEVLERLNEGADVAGIFEPDAEAPIKMYFMGFNCSEAASAFLKRWRDAYKMEPDEARAFRLAWDLSPELRVMSVDSGLVVHDRSDHEEKRDYLRGRNK